MKLPFIAMHIGLADDPLCRVSLNIVIAGCHKMCDGCCNPELWSTENATWVEVDDLIGKIFTPLSAGLIDSIVLLGGDWGEYPEETIEFTAKAYEKFKIPFVLYTGETYETLPEEIRKQVEIIIDGRYDRHSRGIYPASTNQRVFVNGEQVDPTQLAIFSQLSKK